MKREELFKKKILDEMVANDFARLNGKIMRTLGVFARPWMKGNNLKDASEQEDDSDIYSSLDYLQQCNLISVRVVGSTDPVEVYDFDIEELEFRVTADGVKLLMMKKKDELVELK